MSQQTQAREMVEAALIAKAQAEPSFREALLKNPKASIESALGTKLPTSVDLRVVEETATTNYLVLPAATSGELSEAELETAAGGGFFPALLSAAARGVQSDAKAQARSDLGQQLQLALQEANNIYTR